MSFLIKYSHNNKFIFFFLFLCLISILFFVSLSAKHEFLPSILADESGYLGNARYISLGKPIYMGGSTYYSFGYSIIIAPAFWVFEKPLDLYRAIIFINVILASLVFPILLILARQLQIKINSKTIFFAFLVCLTPYYISNINYAWTEITLSFFFISFLSLFCYCINKKRSAIYWVLFSFLAAYLYAIHPRMMGIILLVFFFYFWLYYLKKISTISLILGVMSLVTTYWLVKIINNHLLNIAWDHDGFNIVRMLSKSFSFDGLINLLYALLGQVWYLTVASLGTILLFGLCSKKNLNVDNNDDYKIFLTFLISSSLFILASSVLVMSNPKRLDHTLYGRYNEVFLVVYLFIFGCLAFNEHMENSINQKKLFVATTFFAALTVAFLSLVFYLARHNFNNPYCALHNIASVSYFFGENCEISTILKVGFIAFVFLFLLGTARFFIKQTFLFFCLALIGHNTLQGYSSVINALNINKQSYQSISIAEQYLNNLGNITINYDMDDINASSFYLYQFIYPNITYVSYENLDKFPNSYIVSKKNLEKINPNFNWVAQYSNDQNLWFFGKKQMVNDLYKKIVSINFFHKNIIETPSFFIKESGFYGVESSKDKKKIWRWTNGKASINFSPHKKICSVNLGFSTYNPNKADISIVLNGNTIFKNIFAAGYYNKELILNGYYEHFNLMVLSNTFQPGGEDGRILGIAIESIIFNPCIDDNKPVNTPSHS